MNQWVLITGATQGIGHELAKLFAADGWHLVLLARDAPRLAQIAAELEAHHGIKVRPIAKDLSVPGAAGEIFAELQRDQVPISILVNNAGFGYEGYFADVDWRRHHDLIQVNITALVELTHLFLPPMLARREGRIMNVASVAAFMPGPLVAIYYASKAFVLSFSRALGRELRGSGVTVTAFCPGLTRTQFHVRGGMERPDNFIMMEADVVAKMGYRALMRGRPVVITGWINKVFVFAGRFLPVGVMMSAVGKGNRTKLRRPKIPASD
jgi:short-subunit dehydrogenase